LSWAIVVFAVVFAILELSFADDFCSYEINPALIQFEPDGPQTLDE
jgi:hypothetical protein